MNINENIENKQHAVSYAVEWQHWVSEQNLSYGELAEWNIVFCELAKKFDLSEEFIENGII